VIDWRGIKEALASLIADVSELGPASIRWKDEGGGSTWVADPAIFLRLSATQRQGIEEERREDHRPDDDVVVVTGQRRFALMVRCESFEQDIASPRFAGAVLDRIATRIMRQTSLARLAPFCAIEERRPTKWFSSVNQGRQTSVYALDVMMRTVDNDIDAVIDSGGFISEVIGQSTSRRPNVRQYRQGSSGLH